MPLGPFEREVLRLIAVNRNPDSFVAGATVLHQSPASPRSSQDVDIFHDSEEALAQSAEADTRVLRAAGYEVIEHKREATFRRALVQKGRDATKLEWVHDSAFRFFPAEPDAEMGWRLNFWDAATNKVLALFGRHVFRDYVDTLYLHEKHLHLGALTWAAAGKDGGLTPELIIDWSRRSSRYTAEDVEKVRLPSPPDLRAMKLAFLQATEESESLFTRLPMEEMGCLYLDASGKPVCPNPDSPEFPKLTRHYGSVKGAWPRIVES